MQVVLRDAGGVESKGSAGMHEMQSLRAQRARTRASDQE